ncbi:MAG: VWA domain-containing protein [Myxococcota bacterium]
MPMQPLIRAFVLALGLTLPLVAPSAQAAAAPPIDVVFVLDNSGSMRAHDPDFLTRRAVLEFAHDLADRSRAQDFVARIGVVLFDEETTLALPLTPLVPETVETALAPALARLDYEGQRTRSADAIERALYALRTPSETAAAPHQAIVLLTDGKLDTGDPGRDLEAATWLREDLAAESLDRGIRIFGLAFTERADYQLLQALARKTGAAYYRAEHADELAPIARQVLGQLGRHDAAQSGAAPEPGRDGPPAVAAAPLADAPAARARERLGWIPVAVVLAAAGGFVLVHRRARTRASDARRTIRPARDEAAARLLDVGGVLGETGRTLVLHPGRTRIGRDDHNDIVIADDTISSEHAVIERVEGRYWLEDLRSTNGTRHADRRLAPGERVLLKGGDHVRFAEIDLMFVYPGHVPGGATVVLPSTSAPASARPGARGAIPDGAGRVGAIGAGGALATGGGTGGVVASVTPLFDDRSGEAFRACLDEHLSGVAALSRDFADFVARAFDDDMRDAVRVAASELVRTAGREGRLVRRTYMRDRVRFVLCGVAGDVAAAARAYRAGHGGFSRFLSEEMDDERFRDGRCRILAVLTCGRASGTPWVSLSVVPDLAHHRPIDLMSYELLSDDERRALAPRTQGEASRSGHA